MPTFDASPTTAAEIVAATVAGGVVYKFQPPKEMMAQVIAISGGSAFMLSQWLINQDTGLLTLFEQGLTFASSAPIIFFFMWVGLIMYAYLELLAAFGIAMITGTEEALVAVFEFIGPLRWMLNPFSINYLWVIVPLTFVVACLFSPVAAYPIFAILDATGNDALKPVGVDAKSSSSIYGGRDTAYGWGYVPADLVNFLLSYPLALYDGGKRLVSNHEIIPLLTFPITGLANQAHRLGDLVYDLANKDLFSGWCLTGMFSPPPVVMSPSFKVSDYAVSCPPITVESEAKSLWESFKDLF